VSRRATPTVASLAALLLALAAVGSTAAVAQAPAKAGVDAAMKAAYDKYKSI
jgi:hypothetical protein